MFNQVLYLIPVEEKATGLGVLKRTEKPKRQVFCDVQSVSMSENFAGKTAGFKPELRAKLADRLDYQGENLCEFMGVRYEIYRTYYGPMTNGIELYLQKRAGASDG